MISSTFSKRVLQSVAKIDASGAASIAKRSLASNAGLVSEKTKYHIDLEEKYGAHNYHPLPVVLKEAKGVCLDH
jgi:hypothetical protein